MVKHFDAYLGFTNVFYEVCKSTNKSPFSMFVAPHSDITDFAHGLALVRDMPVPVLRIVQETSPEALEPC